MPELAAELEAAYHELFESELAFPPSTATPQPPDPDTLEKLRSLGYSASSLRQRPGESGGKDLKEMLPFYRRVLHAMGLVSSGNATVAVEVLLALLNEEPSNERVLWMLAELAATTPYVADDVLPVLEEALAQSHVPSAMVQQTWVNCGRGYLAKNDNWRALECFSKAQKNKRDYPAPYWWLGLTYLRLDRRAEAIEAMGRAADLFGPEVERTRIVLGLVLFADGQHRKAAREWGRLLDREAGTDVIWRVADGCPLDPAIAERVCPALQHAAGDRTLPPRVRAVVSIVCSNYL